MRPEAPITRILIQACSVVLLWLMSVSSGFAAQGPRVPANGICDPYVRTISIRKLIRQMKAGGGPIVHRSRRAGTLLSPRMRRVARQSRLTGFAGDAIQNDAPAATIVADPFVEPRGLTTLLLEFEQRPVATSTSPRSPRGPPTTA